MIVNQQQKIFAIIGAGPKGIAVAVKAKVLREFGFTVDQVVLIEKNDIAANWSGDFGYTNGEMKLGTPPEKDVVFPIEVDVGDPVLNARIKERLLHFSWLSFLAHTDAYADWIDRGRHAPTHTLWAAYLQWVFKQLASDVSIIHAQVTQIDLTRDGNRWLLNLQTATEKNFIIEADRLMLTGPGKPRVDFFNQSIEDYSPPIYDLETFWHALKEKQFSVSGKTAIVGSGEHAASVLLALAKYSPTLSIDIISPKGFISSRAEGYYENQLYSQPEKSGWEALTLADRWEFINRTDIAVFSLHAMNILSNEMQHKIIPGRVTNIHHEEDSIALNLTYNQTKSVRVYDQVILATGFDQVAQLKSLLTQRAEQMLIQVLGSTLTQQRILPKIDSNLSVQGMRPYLHLPMLAGLMQGPGFANLSCLGKLSDRLITNFNYKDKQVSNQQIIHFYRRQNNHASSVLCKQQQHK